MNHVMLFTAVFAIRSGRHNSPLSSAVTANTMAIVVSRATRYYSTNRALRKTKSRIPWRYRQKKHKEANSITPAEKKEKAQKAKDRKERTNSKLNDALRQVWQLAEQLFDDLGTNTVKYWYERLLQQSGKKRYMRKTSRWNAFLSKETRIRNEGV
jgi:hypothetical protein